MLVKTDGEIGIYNTLYTYLPQLPRMGHQIYCHGDDDSMDDGDDDNMWRGYVEMMMTYDVGHGRRGLLSGFVRFPNLVLLLLAKWQLGNLTGCVHHAHYALGAHIGCTHWLYTLGVHIAHCAACDCI